MTKHQTQITDQIEAKWRDIENTKVYALLAYSEWFDASGTKSPVYPCIASLFGTFYGVNHRPPSIKKIIILSLVERNLGNIEREPK